MRPSSTGLDRAIPPCVTAGQERGSGSGCQSRTVEGSSAPNRLAQAAPHVVCEIFPGLRPAGPGTPHTSPTRPGCGAAVSKSCSDNMRPGMPHPYRASATAKLIADRIRDLAHRKTQAEIAGDPERASAQALCEEVVHGDNDIPNVVAKAAIQSRALVIMAQGDLIRGQRLAHRGGRAVRRPPLPLGLGAPMLGLRDRTRQQLHGSPAIRSEGGTRFGPANDRAKVFRHHQPGKESSIAVQKVSDCARHRIPVCSGIRNSGT